MSGFFVCSQGKSVDMDVWGAPSVRRCHSDRAALPRGDTKLHSLHLALQRDPLVNSAGVLCQDQGFNLQIKFLKKNLYLCVDSPMIQSDSTPTQ